MDIKASLELLTTLADKKNEVRFSFIKQVLLMASSLFGILVSLHKAASTDSSTRISFALALGLLSLGILFLTAALYTEVVAHKRLFLKWKEEVLLRIRDEGRESIKMLIENPPKIYILFETVAYFSFILSIIFLTIYAVLIA